MTQRNADDKMPCDREAGHDGPHRHHKGAQLVSEWTWSGCIAGTIREPEPTLFDEVPS